MNFNQHYKQRGLHATFSPSQCSWLRYDDEKALSVYVNKQASERGSRLHAWAKETIDLGIKQPKSKKTLYMYVNDAIGYKMDTEDHQPSQRHIHTQHLRRIHAAADKH